MSKIDRPLGITILAILNGLGGAFLLLIALAILAFGASLYDYLPNQMISPNLFSGVMAFAGGIILIVSILVLVASYGLWMGMKWAWYLEFIGTLLSLLLSLGSLPSGVISIVIDAAILWYLWQPHVRAYFSMIVLTPAMNVPPPPTNITSGDVVYCAKCGTPNTKGSKFCTKCGAELPKDSG